MREATIQRISKIEPIENADKLEKAFILGWQVVVLKGDFQPGDLCVYIEIDSVVPEIETFEFLRPRHFRIKTIKLRGVLSQGIAFPLSALPDSVTEVQERLDVTEIMGVKHFERPISANLRGIIRGGFPGYVLRTDEPNVESIPEILNELKGVECVSTIKVHGTSGSYIIKSNDYQVCSRNNSFKLDVPENDKVVYVMMSKKYDIENKLKSLGINIALQGEVAGPGIEKNKLELKEIDLFIFNAYLIDSQKYLGHDPLIVLCHTLGLKTVVEDQRFVFNHTLDQLKEMAHGKYPGTKNNREGIVIRPLHEMFSETTRGRMSFKVVSNKFRLEDEE